MCQSVCLSVSVLSVAILSNSHSRIVQKYDVLTKKVFVRCRTGAYTFHLANIFVLETSLDCSPACNAHIAADDSKP